MEGEVGGCDWVWDFGLWVNAIESLSFSILKSRVDKRQVQACGLHSHSNIIIYMGNYEPPIHHHSHSLIDHSTTF